MALWQSVLPTLSILQEKKLHLTLSSYHYPPTPQLIPCQILNSKLWIPHNLLSWCLLHLFQYSSFCCFREWKKHWLPFQECQCQGHVFLFSNTATDKKPPAEEWACSVEQHLKLLQLEYQQLLCICSLLWNSSVFQDWHFIAALKPFLEPYSKHQHIY